MKYVQIESRDVLSKIIDGVTVYCADVSSERCMACNTMTLEAIKSFVSNPKIIFLTEESSKEKKESQNGKKE